MRPLVVLSLLLTLALSDGLDDVFSVDQTEATPCQQSTDNNGFNNFNSRHILQSQFNRKDEKAWNKYLMEKQLCGRAPTQSFFCKGTAKGVKRICNGGGVRSTENLCTSKRKLKVFVVQSELKDGQCAAKVQVTRAHVTVACEVIDNKCVPVHFETQSDNKPPKGEICKRRKSFLE